MGRLALSVLSVLLSVSLAEKVLATDTLDAVKKRGVLIAGVKVSSPPFGSREARRACMERLAG